MVKTDYLELSRISMENQDKDDARMFAMMAAAQAMDRLAEAVIRLANHIEYSGDG
jgi:hypothetical protein